VEEEVDEGNDNDDGEDDGDIIPVTNDVLQGVETKQEQDVVVATDPPHPSSASNTGACKICREQHGGIYDKQCEVAHRLFKKIQAKIGENANTKFIAFEVFVLVPNLNSLYRQTVSRLKSFIKQVQERIDLISRKKATFLAGPNIAKHVFKSSTGQENKTIFGEMQKAIKKRKDTLFLLIHDEAHYEATKDGAVDGFINSRAVLESDNVVTLLVSATPYNLVSNDSRIPEDNVVDWWMKDPSSTNLEAEGDADTYFGLAKYVNRTLTMQDKLDSEGGFIAADKKFEQRLMFELIDQDKDGFITESEFKVCSGMSLKSLDKDCDGKISRSKWDTVFAESRTKWDEVFESRRKITKNQGLKAWRCVGTDKPANGRELSNANLAGVLKGKTTALSWFTQKEWDAFGIKIPDKNQTKSKRKKTNQEEPKPFIKAGDAFFQPVDFDEQRCNLLIDEYCMFMEQVVDVEAASRQGDKAPVSKYTERIVRDLLENSVGGRGCMVLVRVTDKKFGQLIARRLRECRRKLGLQQKFAVVLDTEESKGLSALLKQDSSEKEGRDWLTRLRQLNGWDAEMDRLSDRIKDCPEISKELEAERTAFKAKPVCYEDLKDLPCFLILCQKGKMGDTFPTSLKYYDMRMRYANSCETRAPVEQDLGRAFRYAKPESCPLVLVGQECANQLVAPQVRTRSQRTDCADLVGLKPDEKMNGRTAPAKLPQTEYDKRGVRHDLKVYREEWKAAEKHYDFDNGTDNQSPRRFLLIGRPQIGKTGAFLRLLKLLWDWCRTTAELLHQVREPLPEPEEPFRDQFIGDPSEEGYSSSDDDDGGQKIHDANRSHGGYPDFDFLKDEKFKDNPSAGKYGNPRDEVLISWYLCGTCVPRTYVEELVDNFDPGSYPNCIQCGSQNRHYQKEIHPRANETSTSSSNSSEQTSWPLSSIGGASASSTKDQDSTKAAGVGETHSQSVSKSRTRYQHLQVKPRDGPVTYKEFQISLGPTPGYKPKDATGTLSVPESVVGDWFDQTGQELRIKKVSVDTQMIPFPIFMPTRGRADCGFLVRDERLLSLADNQSIYLTRPFLSCYTEHACSSTESVVE
jgi:hypothetical protein